MAVKMKGKDILVRKAPLLIHFKIDQHMEDTGLGKREAVLDLLDRATKTIKIRVTEN
jgi:hypothetical protein